MLNKINRITAPADFRRVMNKGRRTTTKNVVISVVKTEGATRFGFVVSKAVGNAVVRNRVKRQLREFAQSVIDNQPTGMEVVVRALPAAGSATNTELVSGVRL